MQHQIVPQMQKITYESPKYIRPTLNDSFRTNTQKFHQTENSEDEHFKHQKFNKTHFKTKIRQLDSSKYSEFEDGRNESEIKSLVRIEQKLKRHTIFSQREEQFILNKSQKFRFPGLQTTKNRRFMSPKGDSVDEQRDGSEDIDSRPLTLKKRINMIRKHKELMQQQFQERKVSLQYNKRALQKQESRIESFKSKLEKVQTIRNQRSKQKTQNSFEIAMHNQQVLRRNQYLKSTVLNTHGNLRNSRVSLYIEKNKLANQTRLQKHVNMQELRSYENQTILQNKQKCEEIKNLKARTHQSVEEYSKKKIMTVNQKKLQQISKELVSLHYQKKTHNNFYRANQVNDSYKNKIKNKKVELQQKAKVYKASLMLELNKSQRTNKNEEESMVRLRSSSITEVYRKKQEVETSTAPDLNFSSTKSNCIYKRWNNPKAVERLRTEPSP